MLSACAHPVPGPSFRADLWKSSTFVEFLKVLSSEREQGRTTMSIPFLPRTNLHNMWRRQPKQPRVDPKGTHEEDAAKDVPQEPPADALPLAQNKFPGYHTVYPSQNFVWQRKPERLPRHALDLAVLYQLHRLPTQTEYLRSMYLEMDRVRKVRVQ